MRGTPARRWLACVLLGLFMLVQGVALSHAVAEAHEHDGACAVCRLVDDQTTALSPNHAETGFMRRVIVFAMRAPDVHTPCADVAAHPPRAPPSA